MKNRNVGKERIHMQKFCIIEQGVNSFFLCCFSEMTLRIQCLVLDCLLTQNNEGNLGKDEN